jgi:hypothetical protein
MAYYGQTNTPYDVQANQGGKFDFASVKQRYQEVKPLIGKRKAENIRPIKRRDRYWEQVFEVNENEYYVSFDAYKFRTIHNKAISWSLNDGMETMTIHTPKKMWGTTPSLELCPRLFSASSTFWFYEFNLPHQFSMVNHRASKYVRYDGKYYSLELGDVVFQRKVGSNNWLPLVVHREFKHTIDRKQTKELRETIEPFMAYYDIMHDIVDSKWEWGNAIARALNDGELGAVKPQEALALFKPNGDDVPNEWLSLVERYKHRLTAYTYQDRKGIHQRHKLAKTVCKDLFEIVKPCKTTEVPIGTLTHDRYKGWYR